MTRRAAILLLVMAAAGCRAPQAPESGAEGSTTFAAERAKARLYPYANDLGPASIDVSGYPAGLQDTYRSLILTKCARCHGAQRVLFSQFVEPPGDAAAQSRIVSGWKQAQPELFQDPRIWQVEPKTAETLGIWERYIKRMMSKPGAGITPEEALRIWTFLTYDSVARKTGEAAPAWERERRRQLDEFKRSNRFRYQELYETR